MISGEGEKVDLASGPSAGQLRVRGNVEEWLTSVEQRMKKTLHDGLYYAFMERVNQSPEEWILKEPAQIVLTLNQIYWCNKITQIMQSGIDPQKQLNELLQKIQHNLAAVAGLVQFPDLWMSSNSNINNSFKRTLISSVIVMDVHHRDVVESLIKNRCSSVDNFEWVRQMRYYIDAATNNCIIRQATASFVYGYEYLGCTPRLVITPLTNRCYLTITGALRLSLGGAPEGPAGTGKTETCKDLSKALGRQCLVCGIIINSNNNSNK